MNENSQVTVYSPEPPIRSPFTMVARYFKDMMGARQLIWILFVRDLKAQYRQSILGYLWLIFPPFGTAVVWYFLRSQRIIRIETEIPYILFVLIGLTVWISFLAFLKAPLAGFQAGKSVYTKHNVPVEAFVASKLLRTCFDTMVRLVVLIPVFILTKIVPPPTAFLFPIALIFLFSISTSIGLLCVPFGSLYGDVGNALSNFLRVFMFLSPVIYPIGVREGLLNDIMINNPITPGIALSRDVITTGSLEWFGPAAIVFSISLVIGIVALYLMRISKPHLIARMGM